LSVCKSDGTVVGLSEMMISPQLLVAISIPAMMLYEICLSDLMIKEAITVHCLTTNGQIGRDSFSRLIASQARNLWGISCGFSRVFLLEFGFAKRDPDIPLNKPP
jgi:hypothetical protein